MLIFSGKHLCWSLFLIKLWAVSSATLLKRHSNTGVLLWILQHFENRKFWRKSVKGCFWIMSRQIFNQFIWRRWPYINFSQHSEESTYTRVSFLVNVAAGLQLKPIFIQKQVPALVFFWQLSEFFNNNFFKKHCYKKESILIRKVDHLSITNLITQLFI